jgi:hypothetical protein
LDVSNEGDERRKEHLYRAQWGTGVLRARPPCDALQIRCIAREIPERKKFSKSFSKRSKRRVRITSVKISFCLRSCTAFPLSEPQGTCSANRHPSRTECESRGSSCIVVTPSSASSRTDRNQPPSGYTFCHTGSVIECYFPNLSRFVFAQSRVPRLIGINFVAVFFPPPQPLLIFSYTSQYGAQDEHGLSVQPRVAAI